MKRLVIDTSVAVKWVVPEFGRPEDDTDQALDLLEHALIAPDCVVGEFANALYKKVQRNEIDVLQAREAVAILPDIVDFAPSPPLVSGAFELSLQIQHPVHDCVFLVLAMTNEGLLITADQKFIDKCRRTISSPPLTSLKEFHGA